MREITRVVVHHAGATTTTAAMRRHHIEDRGWSDIGYHYVVEECGKVRLGRPVHRQGAHVVGHNRDTIGVCVAVDARHPVTFRTMGTLVRLIADLVHQYRLTASDVFGHGELAATQCPGLDIKQLRTKVREALHE